MFHTCSHVSKIKWVTQSLVEPNGTEEIKLEEKESGNR